MPNQKKALGRSLEKSHETKAQARGLRAKRQPLSGALPDYKGDTVVEERALGEGKVRSVRVNPAGKRMITLDLDWLHKVEDEAQSAGFEFAYVFFRPKGTKRCYVLLGEEEFLDLMAEAAEGRKVSSQGGFLKRVFGT